jgi:hypothetical protein
MSRKLAIVFVIVAAGAALLLFPMIAQAGPAFEPVSPYRLNSEGDEWVLVDPNQVDPAVPAPLAAPGGQGEDSPAALAPAILPGAEAALGLALDQAREAGPQAVLAFVNSQPDPGLPLLQAARQDALNELAPPAPAAPDAPAVNYIGVNGGPCAYDNLQTAVNAAASGATLRLAAGTYLESVDISAKTLTIEGGYAADCTTFTGALTRYDPAVAGSVVDLNFSAVVTLRYLDLTGGTSFGAGVDLLGASRARLENTNIHDNAGASGGGMYIGSTSVLTYTSNTDIHANTASAGGGGIVYGTLYGFDSASDIYQNSSTGDGGGLYVGGGKVYLDNADVAANTATANGGGFYVADGEIHLSNSVFVGETAPCCQSAANGGGIYASNSRVYLEGSASTVMNNTSTANGGGLYLVNGSHLTVTGGSLGYDNQAISGNDAVLGAGMYVDASTVDFSGRIINNIASNSGGGVYATGSTITMTNTTVGGTAANTHNQIGATGLNGAGMYLYNNTHARLENVDILSNTLSNPATGYAGGIYVRAGSVITMTDSSITQHHLPSAFDGRGAALYIYDATVTLSNTQVLSNTTRNLGGGARLFGASRLDVLGGSSFKNNKALGGVGGAIAATNSADININNAVIQFNTASTNGGGIYIDAGTLDFSGSWDVRYNQAGANGGAVAVTGTGDADFRASTEPGPSYLAANHANGNGGALYVANTDTLQLHAADGYDLNLNANSASGDGGAAYANTGAFFDVYGRVQASSNIAGGNGGAFYLNGGSRLWMDDYFNDPVRLRGNTAAAGGAIYAVDSPRVECDGAEFGFASNGNKALTGSGGAIYLSGSTLSADNCTFRDNQAQDGNGGAIAAYNSSTLKIDTDYPVAHRAEEADPQRAEAPQSTPCNPLLNHCSSLSGNTAVNGASGDGFGGAIFNSGSALTMNNTYLDRNTADRGGAIYQEGATATGVISNTLVYNNTSLVAFGAGIRAADGAMTLWHTTLANNTGGAGYSPGLAQSYIYNSIIWGNSVAAYGALTTAVCNIDQGGTAGPATNPQFSSPGAGEDYRLRPFSPAIDACSSGLPRDLLNQARPIRSLYDMGAFEMLISELYLPVIAR